MPRLLGVSKSEETQESLAWSRLTEQERATYAARIKPARTEAKMTQLDLATAAGVSRGTVANMESAKVVPQAEHLRSVMLALDLVLDGTEWSDGVREWVGVLAPLIERIPPAKRGELLGRVVVLLGEAMTDHAPQ